MNANCMYLIRRGYEDETLDFCILREDAGHTGICEGQCDDCSDKELVCPNCGTSLKYFADFGYEHFYCKECMDRAYNDKGEHLGRME